MVTYGIANQPCYFDVISTTITDNSSAKTATGFHMRQYSTVNMFNSVVSGNTGVPEFVIGTSNNSIEIKNTIVSDKVYDTSGTIVNGVDFNTETIQELADNGGFTSTCLILSEDNPAITNYGMSVAALNALASSYTPQIPQELIAKDQIGVSREDLTFIGALIDPALKSSVDAINEHAARIYTQKGSLSVEPIESSHLVIYSISGVKLFDRIITQKTDISLQQGVYLLKINNQISRVLVK